jgi:RAQPRD family integrative conjugative element protein
MRPLMNIKLAFLLVVLLSLNPAYADDDLERANLAKLVQEIDFLLKRIDQIKLDTPEAQRVRFHYDVLKADLNLIRTGIHDHITASLKSGRIIKPLSGQYHEHH